MSNILTKLCVLSTLIGIILLIIISDKLDVPTSTISSLSKEDINNQVKVKGIVNQVVNKESIIILNLKDASSSIKVVLFNPKESKIKKNSFVEVDGKISLYEDKLEIIADSVKIIN